MYVLSTDSGELHYFPTPQKVPGGYAILSHVWDESSEQTFMELETIAKECKESGANPWDRISRKIRGCCTLAKKHGYRWIWNDTCCIDKRSNTELSEAINSMFRYYSLAKVCYAYLRDVPRGDDDLHADDSAFRKSRWHKRGWTLQELIAPKFLIFISGDWRILNGRTEISDVLEEITKVPAPLLRLETKVSDYSVAQRMSWAAERETTREEDRAYSLLGIFGIHMPTLYGEGENAFLRLQEEIMRHSIDPSLFLWGDSSVVPDPWITSDDIAQPCEHEDSDSYLLATSPNEFEDCSDVEFRSLSTTGVIASQIEKLEHTGDQDTAIRTATILSERLPMFTLTPYGVHARLPVVRYANGLLLAILPCFRGGQCLGFFLSPCLHSSDPSRPVYHIFSSHSFRVFVVDDLQSFCVRVVEWKDVYIPLWPPLQQVQNPIPTLPINIMLSPPFRISEASMDNIYQAAYRMYSASPTSPRWTGTPHIAVVFRRRRDTDKFMEIRLGRCESDVESTGSREPGHLGPRWATIKFRTSEDDALGPELAGHTCPDDHICLWPDGKRRIQDPYMTQPGSYRVDWLLAFTPCGIHPDITRVANLEWIETDLERR